VLVTLEGTYVHPLSMGDRTGEVCMVLRRPNGALLTAIKTFYPPGCYRLLTGGVEHGEGIEAALRREVLEETGLETQIARFLAVIEYQAANPAQSALPDQVFSSFAFLLDERGGTLAPQDPGERLESFREVALADLPALAETLERVTDSYSDEIEGRWRDWGVFRAVVHRVVYELLA
jgi:ADP-ribose pyrophosphatase YjhB (NUDIX family)